MIDVVLICLNDEKNICTMCTALNKSSYNKLIIVDGGSKDQTLAIAKAFTPYVFSTTPGMAHQTRIGLSEVTSEYVFLAEADHVYPLYFLQNLQKELLATNWDAIQGTLDVSDPHTFWEKCHKLFYYVHQHDKGERPIIACPQLWKTSSLISLFSNLHGGESYCFDTQRAETASMLSLKCGLGSTVAFEDQHIGLSKFLKRHLNYGAGDFDFYSANQHSWSLRRKLLSLTHVFRRYGFEYPIKSIQLRTSLVAVFYFYAILIVRYTGFFAKSLHLF